MMPPASHEEHLHLRSERLCLDFANTVSNHASDAPAEWLNSYADLVNWAAGIGLVAPAEAERLRRQAAHAPAAAEAVLRRALKLREAMYHLLRAPAHGAKPDPADLAVLNAELPRALAQARLEPAGEAYTLAWPGVAQDGLDHFLWPVAHSAAEVLTSPELLSRVGECADDRGCGWLFLDLTKNRSRRWCDMRDCGNRAKARRHFQRKKAAQA
jgi:predicted RNA-binding Zn ribbon-like protein